MVIVCPYQNLSSSSQLRPLHERVLENFAEYGESVCLEDAETGQTWTFPQVVQGSCSVAKELPELGFEKGDVVAVFLENRPEYVMLLLGLSSLGGTITGINPMYTSEEFERQVSDSGSRFLLTRKELLGKALKAPSSKKFKKIFVYGGLDEKYSRDARIVSLNQLFRHKSINRFPNVPIDIKEDVIILPYSSGTTGLPKGVMLTHSNMNFIFLGDPKNPKVTPFPVRRTGEAGVLVLPFFHIAGFMGVLWTMSFGGRAIVLPKFDALKYVETVAKHRAAHLMVVPAMLTFLAKHPAVAKFDLSCVKRVGVGSAPVSKEIIKTLLERFPNLEGVEQGYGMTESGGLIAVTPKMPLDKYLYGSTGIPSPGSEIKIMDIKDSGVELGPDERGEIWVRSPGVMKGYKNKPEATKETVDKDGWLHTGDIGYSDAFGHIYVVDRLKELIKYKGYQVPPAELEDVLLKHPAVQDAGVTGIPNSQDSNIGELATAFVVLKSGFPESQSTRDDILQFVNDQVAPYKKLRGGLRFLNELPKGGSGKLLRRKLKEMDKRSKL